MGYDAWKTESDRDYHERRGTHQHDAESLPSGGRCACGVETMRSVAGTGWQCKQCGEAAMSEPSDYYRTCALPKPEPRCVTKKRRDKVDARDERACREIVRKRDKGKCRIPGCIERATDAHHIVFRSKSKARRWDPQNLVSLCKDHHRLRHAGVIHISGDADAEIIVTGDMDALKFRL